ncbi:MAG: hypothetical protein KGR26_16490 [Cyanobacteria bacterium REEB65]|nr:hypothetical protein [Cyanobacteria bacterium REEB65]
MSERVASDKEIADWVRGLFPTQSVLHSDRPTPIISECGGDGHLCAVDEHIRIRPGPPHLATPAELADGLQCTRLCHMPAVALAKRGNVLEGRCIDHALPDDLYLIDPGEER